MRDFAESEHPDTAAASAPGVSAADYFSLFGLPRALRVDEDDLTRRYHRLQNEVHPDRYAGASVLLRQLALQQASRINDAYAVLKDRLRRAAYLLSLYGTDVYAETRAPLSAELLEQQLEWREQLAEADDAAARAAILAEVAAAKTAAVVAAESALTALVAAEVAENEADTQQAYELLCRWIYLDKLQREAAG